MDRWVKSRQLADMLVPAVERVAEVDGGVVDAALGVDNAAVDRMVTEELRLLVDERPSLGERAQRLAEAPAGARRGHARAALARNLAAALRSRPHLLDAFWPLLVPEPERTPAATASKDGRRRRIGLRCLDRQLAALLLTAAVASVVVVAVWAGDRQFGRLTVAELFAVWVLAFVPGWLYVRFIGQRAGALWDEFVLNLYRLGLDEPQHLPPPPVNSQYHQRWFDAGGPALSRHRNIYRQKFDAYYGRSVSEATHDSRVKADTFFPVVLTTTVFAVGWTIVFWSDTLRAGAPRHVGDVLLYGFLGAYLFDVQMLFRRFFQSDLKPSAYTSAVLRVILVVLLVFVVHQLPMFQDGSRSEEAVVAFVLGTFPLVGIRALNRLVAVVLKSSVQALQDPYPLSDLGGLNIWYEARLLEEGVEDMQNLVSANLVDVILHTRVPVGRLVDWLDQAHLYLHLPPTGGKKRLPVAGASHPRTALATFGVRSASSFLEAVPPDQLDDDGQHRDPLVRAALDAMAVQSATLPRPAALTISRILAAEPGLDPVRKWRAWEEGLASSGRREQVDPGGAATTASNVVHLERRG